MKFIDTIEIKNFKSIRHQKIERCKRINVFIGYPNVGKSNIMEAITTIQYCKLSANQSLHTFFRFENAAELFFEGNAGENAIISYNNLKSVYLEFRDKENVEFFGAKFDPVLIRSSYKNVSEVSDIPDVFKYHFSANNSSDSGTTFRHLQSPLGENLFLMVRESQELRKSFNDILAPYGLRLLIDKTSNALRLIKSIDNDSIFQLPYSLLADTLQRLFFYQTAIFTNKDSVLLFEEPEARMFPPYIKKLTTDVIFDKSNQFFITTHSPYVLDELIAEAGDDLSVYLVDYIEGETKVYYLQEKDLTEIREYGVDLFFNIESYLKHGQINNA